MNPFKKHFKQLIIKKMKPVWLDVNPSVHRSSSDSQVKKKNDDITFIA